MSNRYIILIIFLLSINSAFSKVILIRNNSEIVRILDQNAFKGYNDEFILKGNFDLNGNKIRLPDHSTINLNDGFLSNGTLEGNNSSIIAGIKTIFDKDINIEGTWRVENAYPEWFGAISNTGKDCIPALKKCNGIRASNIILSSGIYNIYSTFRFTNSNIIVKSNASLCAKAKMKYLIFGDFFKLSPTHGIYDAASLRAISGGGTLDGNGLAEIGAVMRRGLRSRISNLTIKGVTKAGILTAYDSEEIGNCYISEIVIMNNLSLKNTIGIWNNRSDCTFSKIEIINFQIGIRNDAGNGKYVDVHPWLLDSSLWENSVAFESSAGGMTLISCEADTMRKFIKCKNKIGDNYLIACKSFINEGVIPKNLSRQFPQIFIDKNGFVDSSFKISTFDTK